MIVWPILLTATLVMLMHAFIVANARSQADAAASQGLRAAWRASAGSDFLADPSAPGEPYQGFDPHPAVSAMAQSAEDAVARAAAVPEGWRWWTPGAVEVRSDWCHAVPGDPLEAPGERRPVAGETGWVRVEVSGEVFGPLAALWPNRWDRVYASAQGPAVVAAPAQRRGTVQIPTQLPEC